MTDHDTLTRRFLDCPDEPSAINEIFSDLHDAYFARVMGALAKSNSWFRHDRDLCERVTQDAFVRLWKSRASFQGNASVFTFLYKIAMNCMLSELERLGREPSYNCIAAVGDAENPDGETDAATHAGDRESLVHWRIAGDEQGARIDQARVADCVRVRLARLAIDHPEAVAAIHMQYYAELKGPEIALALGRTYAATREFLSQARKLSGRALAECWQMSQGKSR